MTMAGGDAEVVHRPVVFLISVARSQSIMGVERSREWNASVDPFDRDSSEIG